MATDIAPNALDHREALRSLFDGLRGRQETLSRLVGELFEEVGHRNSELVAQQEQVDVELQRLTDDRDRLSPEQVSPEAVNQLRAERDDLARELELARIQISHLAGTAADLAEARAELLRLRQDQEQAASKPEELRQQLCELELERRGLESELEHVRTRAAELQQALHDEKQEFARMHAQVAPELAQLRRALERQVEMLTERQFAPALPAASPVARPATDQRDEPRPDPVIDSVMSQFELLQKDRIRRQTGSAPR